MPTAPPASQIWNQLGDLEPAVQSSCVKFAIKFCYKCYVTVVTNTWFRTSRSHPVTPATTTEAVPILFTGLCLWLLRCCGKPMMQCHAMKPCTRCTPALLSYTNTLSIKTHVGQPNRHNKTQGRRKPHHQHSATLHGSMTAAVATFQLRLHLVNLWRCISTLLQLLPPGC
jgi:hypothetical protein